MSPKKLLQALRRIQSSPLDWDYGHRWRSIESLEPRVLLSADVAWAFNLGDSTGVGGEDIEFDSNGAVYLAGDFKESVDFDPGPGETVLTPNERGFRGNSGWDGYVASYNNDGTFRWVTQITGRESEAPVDLSVDETGVYIVGRVQNEAVFDGIVLDDHDGEKYAAKLDHDGNFLWVRQFDGVGGWTIHAHDGSVYMGGPFVDTIEIGGVSMTPDGNFDGLLLSLDASTGDVDWAKQIGGAGAEWVQDIDADESGIYIAGAFSQALEIDSTQQAIIGVNDTFVARLSNTGQLDWVAQAGGDYLAFAHGISLNDTGVFIAGSLYGSATYGDTTLTSASGTEQSDAVFAGLSRQGDFLWARRAGGDDTATAWDVAATADSVYFTGSFESAQADFGSTTLNAVQPGEHDLFVTSLDPTTGAFRWAQRFGDADLEIGLGLDANAAGEIAVTGWDDDGAPVMKLQDGPVNESPVANDDAYAVDEDHVLSVDAASGVLDNDSDAEGDPLTAVLADAPANGSLTLNADGSFTYTPDADFFGTDSFTYQADDGTGTGNLATVTLTVNGVDDAPIAADDTAETLTDTAVLIPVLDNDAEPDGEPMDAIKLSDPLNGIVVKNDDGTFTYTPNEGFTGTDSFTYQASDGTNVSNEATVSVEVLAEPTQTIHGPVSRNLVQGTAIGAGNDVGDDDTSLKLTETGHKGKQFALEHVWEFDIGAAGAAEVNVQAHTSGEPLQFQYSVDGVNWITMFSVTKTADDDTYQSFALPEGTSGSVFIRVIDTDQTGRDRTADTLSVDDIFIASTDG